MGDANLGLVVPDLTAFKQDIQQKLVSLYQNEITLLVSLEGIKDQIPNADSKTGGILLRDFIKAAEIASHLAAKIKYQYEVAHTNAKAEFARAKLERAGDYFAKSLILETSKMKDSAQLRESYAEFDEIYLKAREYEEALYALMIFFQIKSDSFNKAFYAAKAIYHAGTQTPFGRGEDDGGMSGGGKLGDMGFNVGRGKILNNNGEFE